MASTNSSLMLETKVVDCDYPVETCRIDLEEQQQKELGGDLCDSSLSPKKASSGVLDHSKEHLTSVESGSSSSDHGTAFVCINCGKCFNDSIELDMHQSIHSSSTEKSPKDASNEEKNVGSDNTRKKTFICVECGEIFNDSLMLQSHCSTTHKSVEPSKGRRKSGKAKVKKEVKKPFECSVCSQHFEKRSYLLLHMRLHTGERPYKCSVCSKEFRLIGHITSHMTTHIKERPYECSVCDKKFARGDYMKKHMKTHTGEKPYACTVCEKAFTLKGNLERHMISHTKEKRYSCGYCDERFSWEKTLQNHIKKFHGQVFNNEIP